MIRLQNEASHLLFTGLFTAAQTASGYVDKLDYDYCTIDVSATTTDVTSNNFTTLDVGEGLVSNAFTTIAVFEGDATATGGFLVPDGDTSDAVIVARFNIDCSKYERYLRVRAAVLTTQSVTAIARLGYKDESDAHTAAGQGADVMVTG